MSVNNTLLEAIRPYLQPRVRYSMYTLHEDMVSRFIDLHGRFSARQSEAIWIIESIMDAHEKKSLIRNVIELAKVELAIRELEPWARDHVVHALLSFILGIYVNEEFLHPLWSRHVDAFQWKLAGLFHDVGYPMEMARDALVKPYVDTINKIKNEIYPAAPDVGYRFELIRFANLRNDVNSFDLIQKRLDEWGLQIDARRAYDDVINSGGICHGMISSLTVLFLIDLLYQKFNPNREYRDIHVRRHGNVNFNQIYFERDVVSACAAIYIHNLPSRRFEGARIDRANAPVAFLLKLSDTLQQWERPSKENPTGFAATQFDISIDNNQLILHSDIPIDKKTEMENAISSTLIAPDVRIA